MSQQINLLVRETVGPALSAQRSLIGLGAMVVAFLGYAALTWFGSEQLGDTVAQSDAQMVAERATLQGLEQKLAARPKLPDILAQIEAVKPYAAESQELVNLIRGAGREGYTEHLAALARVSEDGVWLTGIKLGNAGKSVSLTGRSLHHESVLRYAQRLNERFSPFGVQFTAVELTPDPARESTSGAALSSVAFKLF